VSDPSKNYIIMDSNSNPAVNVHPEPTLKEKLKASEVRYRRLFESAKDGILILDAATGKIIDVNPYLINLLGFSKEKFIEKEIWEIGFFKDVAANIDKFLELQQQEYVY
jgi:two-component system CheB/CheR fusion protein